MIPIISCQTGSLLRTKSEYNFPSLSGFGAKSFLGRQSRSQLSSAASRDVTDGDQSAIAAKKSEEGAPRRYDHSFEGHHLQFHPCRSFGLRSRHGRYLRNSIVVRKQRRRRKQPLESRRASVVGESPTTPTVRRSVSLVAVDEKKCFPVSPDVVQGKSDGKRLKRKRKSISQQQQHKLIKCAECSREFFSRKNKGTENLKLANHLLIPCSHTFHAATRIEKLESGNQQWTSLADFIDASGATLTAKATPWSSDYSTTSLWAVHGSSASKDRSSDERRSATCRDRVRNLGESIDRLSTFKRESDEGVAGECGNSDNTNNNARDKSQACSGAPASRPQSSSSSSSTSFSSPPPLLPLDQPSAVAGTRSSSGSESSSRRKTFVHSRSAVFPAKLSVIFEKPDAQKSALGRRYGDMNFALGIAGAPLSQRTWTDRLLPSGDLGCTLVKELKDAKTLKVDLTSVKGDASWADHRTSAVRQHLSNQRLLILGHGSQSCVKKSKHKQHQSVCPIKCKQQAQHDHSVDNGVQPTTATTELQEADASDKKRPSNQILRKSSSFQKANHVDEFQLSPSPSPFDSTDSLTVKLCDNDDNDGYYFNYQDDRKSPDARSQGSGSLGRGSKHDCRLEGCERLRINVCGQLFETRRAVLERHPETLLGNSCKRQPFFDSERRELFFDRHRPSFEAIFSYYQHGGRLRRPYHVPSDVFLEELTFFELEEDTVEEYKRSEGYIFEENPLPQVGWMRKVWMLFEDPQSSKAAFCVAVLSVLMTLISIVIFCVETLPYFAKSHCVGNEAPNFLDPFFIIETTCTAWFTIEAIARFVSCPDKIDFWKDFKNIVDVTAVLPYYWTLFNVLSTMSCAGAKTSASLSFLRVIRLIRVFKLTKHSVGLQVLLLTFKASLEGLGLFLVALMVSLLVFSSAVYYAEYGNPDSNMKSIPDAFWWAIITMTTVGYGDKVPLGVTGRLIGAACAITGVLTLAIPVPIITGHFNRFYSHKTGRGRHI